MSLRVRYFASIREALGEGETLAWRPGDTLGTVRDRLLASSPRHAEVLSRSRALRAALNMKMCDESAPVDDGAEVAFFPPVTGG